MTLRTFFIAFICALGFATGALAQPPPLEDFVALASKDEKASEAAADRLAPVWKDAYAAMVLDLARFFRPARDPSPSGVPDDSLGGDEDAQTGSAPRGTGEAFRPAIRTPESLIRGRLMRFLSRQTGKSFGNDLKQWRKWSWTLPHDPHPEYAAFKSRLYANIDPRMATFFSAGTKPRIRLDEIDWGGVGVNGIPPLDQPKTVAAPAAAFMGDKNVVFGLVVNGEARAYPKRILAWHEMALDTLGGVKLAVVYCTLCGTVIPFETAIGDRSFTLGTSGLLYRSNKLMFDLETKSLWSTIEGRPVVGPLAQSEIVLKYRPVVTTTWKEWRTAHPETTVLSLDTGYKRDYDEGVAYRNYFSNDDLMFEVPEDDKRLKRKAEVVTFLAGADPSLTPVALDAAFLKKNPVHLFSAGGTNYVALTTEGGANRIYKAGTTRFVRFSGVDVFDELGRVWKVGEERLESPDGQTATREPARRTFWFAWFSQFPETALIK
ncbi:MAG: DUF3179 domain-containing protein [Vicinamibacteria bacterium]|nr:DUF3179 domain-containing protein [Vicinamibacteria bacterium]